MEEARTQLVVERRGAIALFTLNGPDRMNALSRHTVTALDTAARAAESDPSVRAIVITGAGDKAFCAGADLKERQGMTIDDVRAFLSLYRVAFGTIDRLSKPVIAAINGVAFGGGLELALACDFRLVHANAQIGLTETSLAIIPGAGGTQRLPRIVGEAKAKELVLFAERLTAARALEVGLVNRVVPAGTSVVEAALAFAAPFETAAPIAVAAALHAIDAAANTSIEEGLSIERQCYERTLVSEDRLEALAAFAQKRKPIFAGK